MFYQVGNIYKVYVCFVDHECEAIRPSPQTLHHHERRGGIGLRRDRQVRATDETSSFCVWCYICFWDSLLTQWWCSYVWCWWWWWWWCVFMDPDCWWICKSVSCVMWRWCVCVYLYMLLPEITCPLSLFPLFPPSITLPPLRLPSSLYLWLFFCCRCSIFSVWFYILSLSPVSRQWFYPMVGDIMLFYHRVEPRTGCWEVSASVRPSLSPYNPLP